MSSLPVWCQEGSAQVPHPGRTPWGSCPLPASASAFSGDAAGQHTAALLVTLHLVARWDSSWLAVCRRQSGSVLPGRPCVSLVYLRPLCCRVDFPPKATTEF